MYSTLLLLTSCIGSIYADCQTSDKDNCLSKRHSNEQIFGWCGFCESTNECIDIQEYCDNKSLCTGNFEWNKNNPYDNCHQAKSMQTLILTFIGLVFGLVYYCCFTSIIKQTIIKIIICSICFIIYSILIIISAIKSWNQNHWKMLYLWTLGSGLALLGTFLSLYFVSKWIFIPFIRFSTIYTSQSLNTSMDMATTTVSAPVRMSLYIIYIILLLTIFIITIYQVFTHQYIIEILPCLSLIVLTLDLIHPVDEIQTKASRNLLASRCPDNPIQITPIELQQSESVETMNPEEYDSSLQEQKYENDLKNHLHDKGYGAVSNIGSEEDHFSLHGFENEHSLDVKYWQLIVFIIYVATLVGFAFAYHEYESCLLSWATILPTLLNVYFFYQRGHKMKNTLKLVYWCSLISCCMIVVVLIVFSSLSCSCYGFSDGEQNNSGHGDENEIEENHCQWYHVIVIVIVGLFAVVDIYHKKNCIRYAPKH